MWFEQPQDEIDLINQAEKDLANKSNIIRMEEVERDYDEMLKDPAKLPNWEVFWVIVEETRQGFRTKIKKFLN